MHQEKEKWLTPELMNNRNKVIGEFLDFTFDEALIQVEGKFDNATEFSDKLTLFAAKSWLIKNKVYALLHDPFAFSIGDLEGLDISPTVSDDDDEDSIASSLFGDDDDDDDDDDDALEIKAAKQPVKKAIKKSSKKNTKQSEDSTQKQLVTISIIKNMSLNGVKLPKDTVMEVSSADAGKLVAENKARIVE